MMPVHIAEGKQKTLFHRTGSLYIPAASAIQNTAKRTARHVRSAALMITAITIKFMRINKEGL